MEKPLPPTTTDPPKHTHKNPYKRPARRLSSTRNPKPRTTLSAPSNQLQDEAPQPIPIPQQQLIVNPYRRKQPPQARPLPICLEHLDASSQSSRSESSISSPASSVHSHYVQDDGSSSSAPSRSIRLRSDTKSKIAELLTTISQEIQEISELTDQMQASMRTTSDAISHLQESPNSPQAPSRSATIKSMTEVLSMASNESLETCDLLTPTRDPTFNAPDEQPLITQPDIALDLSPCPEPPMDDSGCALESCSNDSVQSDNNSDLNSVNINNLHALLQDDISYLNSDVITIKNPSDFRIVLQNPNGIKVYEDKDPEYLPSIETLKDHHADAICLPETNVPWHKHELFYDISMRNKATWKLLPTKTVVASC